MYVVIFTATLAEIDDAYFNMATRLRQRALEYYGCIKFVSSMQGQREIAISYWESLEAITAWKQDALHRQAQEQGKVRWYKDYHVDIAEVVTSRN